MTSINVMILSSGRRVELLNCFKNAKDKLGISGNIICCDASNDAPTLVFADKKYRVPKILEANYIDKIIEICNIENISLIVPTIDTELEILARNKTIIENSTNAKVLISSLKTIKICNDKILSAKFFYDNGFLVPKTLSLSDIENKNYQLPLFIKPKNGSSSINAFKVNTDKELEFFYEYIDEPIVQECVKGVEYTVDVFLDFNSNIISCVPRQRLATRSGEILKGKIDLNEYIIHDVKRLMEKLKPIGHITVQGFLTDENEFKYIEINPRFGGGAPMSIKAGANSPEYLYRLLLGEDLKNIKVQVENNIVFSRFDDSVRVL